MNIEAYNLDSLRETIRKLERENQELKDRLKAAGSSYVEQKFFSDDIAESAEYDPDQGGRILKEYITMDHARMFFRTFWAGKMSMPEEAGKVVAFRSASTDGIIESAQNSTERRNSVRTVSSNSGIH